METIINEAGTLASQIQFKPLTIPQGCISEQEALALVGDINMEQARQSGLPFYDQDGEFMYEPSDIQSFFNLK